MSQFVIEGGKPLAGTVRVHGSKNSALPILAATLLADGIYQLHEIPQLSDIQVMLRILRHLGASVVQDGSTITIDTSTVHKTHIPDDLMSQMRSSIFLMGPLLARFQEVSLSRPGGCAIGERPIDLHLNSLKLLGTTVEEYGGMIRCHSASRLRGNTITLDYPSVGATENTMMAASLASGETQIIGAAKEPEIVDLQNMLNQMGAQIKGAGTDIITIRGVQKLTPVCYTVIPDRIVAGTLAVAVAMTGGQITLTNVEPRHLKAVLRALKQVGCHIDVEEDMLHVSRYGALKNIPKLVTSPYPGLPTDMQAQFMALASIASGTSIITETVFDARFKHVNELLRMGADIVVDLQTAFIRGVPYLSGATVEATDLRAGAALVLAGMAAKGQTTVQYVHHIDRGYENLENMLDQLGATVYRVHDPQCAHLG